MEEFQSIGYQVSQHVLEFMCSTATPVLEFVKETLLPCSSSLGM